MILLDILAVLLVLAIFGYVTFLIGKQKGAKKGFFKDEDDNNVPDFLKNKKKKK